MGDEGRDRKVVRMYINAGVQQVWDAIVDASWNGRYGYRVPTQYLDLRPGGQVRVIASEEMRAHGAPELMIEGEVLEVDAPHRLVQSYRMHFTPEMGAEPFTTLTYELVEEGEGLTRLTLTHDVTDAPLHAVTVHSDTPLHQGGGGWAWVVSDLKSLLECGRSMADPPAAG